jgi:predicted phosphodiesterase
MSFIVLFITIMTSYTTAMADPQEVKKGDMPLFSFGIMTDAHYGDYDSEEDKYYRNSLIKIDEAMQVFDSEHLEFVLELGDLIDRDFRSMMPVNEVFTKYQTAVLRCQGNHDYAVERKYFKLLNPAGNEKGYYSESLNGFRFIILNGNEVSVYGPGSNSERKKAGQLIEKMKQEGKVNAELWNGGLLEEQMKWFESELDSSVAANEKVFIICHFPVWPEEKHVLLDQEEVLDLLSRYNNIIAWFAGHNHHGGYGNYNLIHCVTFRGMVETETENSFAIVDVYKNKIWIRGFGREKSRILAY